MCRFLYSSVVAAAALVRTGTAQPSGVGGDGPGGGKQQPPLANSVDPILSNSISNLVKNATSMTKVGSVDVITVDDGNGGIEKEYGICNIVALTPLLNGELLPIVQIGEY